MADSTAFPQSAPTAEPDVSRVPPSDPIVELERLRQLNRRWRRAALGIGAAFVFLFVLSLVQFLGTLTACKFLYEARRHAAHVNRETAEYLQEIRIAQQHIQQAKADAVGDRTLVAPVPESAPNPEPEDLDDLSADELRARIARLKAKLRDREEQDRNDQERKEREPMKARKIPEKGDEKDREQEKMEELLGQVRQQRQALRRLRNQNLPAGHQPERNCPYPIEKLLDGLPKQ